ncbi:MAG: hypothetical protein ABIS26_01735 [Candidatus Paceibacterota bacterium]
MKSSQLLIFIFITFIIGGLAKIEPAFAISESSINVNVAPASPAPYEDVSITLQSYLANLDSVLISWSVNGKNFTSGIGQKSFSLKAGAAGSQQVVSVRISLPDGEITKTVIISPAIIVLLWQANDSYVPPFYKGKALATASSEIKIVAMPELKTKTGKIDSKNLTYSWQQDYNNSPGDSGYGKNYFLYNNDYLEDSSTISVTASTLNQGSSAEQNITVRTTQPKIIFYKKNSTMGIVWENALGNVHKIEPEGEIVVASPYFISPKELLNPALVFRWSINDRTIQIVGFIKNIIPLKAETGVSGTSKLKLDISNNDKIFETAQKEINIEY